MATRTRVLIIDDHPLFRQGIRWSLEEIGELEVIGEAESGLAKPHVATRVLHQFRELASTEDEQTSALFAPLTSREIEILDCIARGLSNKEIANELSISGQTVKNHITSILSKLQVNDRTMAVIYAIKMGWIRMGYDPPPGVVPSGPAEHADGL